MRLLSVLPIVTLVVALAQPALSQDDDVSQQLDPSATCPWQTGDSIQACLAVVNADEAKAPCSSNDADCYCNVQQGKIDCWKPCPGVQPADDIHFNNNSCKGKNKAAGGSRDYKGSALTTTAISGLTQHTGVVQTSAPSASSSTYSSTRSTSSVSLNRFNGESGALPMFAVPSIGLSALLIAAAVPAVLVVLL